MAKLLETENLVTNFYTYEGVVKALNKVSLNIREGQTLGLIGENGAGKSTLFNVLSGAFPPTEGEVLFKGRNILDLEPEERACEGLFLAFQYPVEIPGVSNTYFLRSALNAIRTHRGEDPLDQGGIMALFATEEQLAVINEVAGLMSLLEGHGGRFQGHAALRAGAGTVSPHLGVHGAGVLGAGASVRRLGRLEGHAAVGAWAGAFLPYGGVHGTGVHRLTEGRQIGILF